MMKRFGTEASYNAKIIESFKGAGGPEILIVVSKLLTGFDAPRNTVLYVCKSLKEHTLLQAIARVNRLFEEDGNDKEFGYVIDYEGLLGELDKALTSYSALGGYDVDDLVGAVHDVREQIRLLPARWNDLWDLFASVPNKHDMEALEQFLSNDELRHEFYARLSSYGKCLHIALSSEKLEDVISADQMQHFTEDLRHFSELRRAVRVRFQEVVDLNDYEPRIQKLLDDHVTALPAEVIIELVNINDPAALRSVVEDLDVSVGSRADRIASATRRTISERMEEDPALYTRFSRMLQDTIDDYRSARLAERDYLQHMIEIADRVANRDRDVPLPNAIRSDEDAAAIYGVLNGRIKTVGATTESVDSEELAQIAQEILEIIRERLIVGIWNNDTAQNQLLNELDDYFWDELEAQRDIALPMELADDLQQHIMDIARARFPR
jgi:type I restriction enzyme R subunit